MELQIRRSYTHRSCQNTVNRYVLKREAHLKHSVTGEGGENLTSLDDAIDSWSAFLDNLEEERNIAQQQSQQEKAENDQHTLIRHLLTRGMPGSQINLTEDSSEGEIPIQNDSSSESPVAVQSHKKRASKRQATLNTITELVSLQKEDLEASKKEFQEDIIERRAELAERRANRLQRQAEYEDNRQFKRQRTTSLDNSFTERVEGLENKLNNVEASVLEIKDFMQQLLHRFT